MKKLIMLVVIILVLAIIAIFAISPGCVAEEVTEEAEEVTEEAEEVTEEAEEVVEGVEEEAVEEVEEEIVIGVSMDTLAALFWVANLDGIRTKAQELNVKLVEVIAEGDANKQNEQIRNLIAQGVDAIVCAPNDGSAIESSVEECKSAGIPIIMDNRPVQGDILPDLQILSDNEAMARDVLQWFVDKAKQEGEIYKGILLIGSLADENAAQRKDGHMEVLDANEDVIQVAVEIPTEWNLETALKGLQNAFQANPDSDLIISPSDYLFPPIKTTLEQIDRWKKIGEEGHVAIVSFDGDVSGMQAMKDGYVWADAAQDAVGQGERCVEWAVKMVNGEKPPEVNMADAGIIVTLDNFDEVKESIWSWPDVE